MRYIALVGCLFLSIGTLTGCGSDNPVMPATPDEVRLVDAGIPSAWYVNYTRILPSGHPIAEPVLADSVFTLDVVTTSAEGDHAKYAQLSSPAFDGRPYAGLHVHAEFDFVSAGGTSYGYCTVTLNGRDETASRRIEFFTGPSDEHRTAVIDFVVHGVQAASCNVIVEMDAEYMDVALDGTVHATVRRFAVTGIP